MALFVGGECFCFLIGVYLRLSAVDPDFEETA